MTTVYFNDTAEFLDELVNDRHLVEREIVRVTKQYVISPRDGMSTLVKLIGTAKVGDNVVCLKQHIGELFGENYDLPLDAKIRDAVEAACEALEEELRDRRFQVRSGFLAQEESQEVVKL